MSHVMDDNQNVVSDLVRSLGAKFSNNVIDLLMKMKMVDAKLVQISLFSSSNLSKCTNKPLSDHTEGCAICLGPNINFIIYEEIANFAHSPIESK